MHLKADEGCVLHAQVLLLLLLLLGAAAAGGQHAHVHTYLSVLMRILVQYVHDARI